MHDSAGTIKIEIIALLNSQNFFLSYSIIFTQNWKAGSKGQMKAGKFMDPTEFPIENSTFLPPPWVACVYTTHLKKQRRPRQPKVNAAMLGSSLTMSHSKKS